MRREPGAIRLLYRPDGVLATIARYRRGVTRRSGLFLAVLAVLLLGAGATVVATSRGSQVASGPVTVIAHHGGSGGPPDTRAAFASALRSGARELELDAQVTRDRHVVVLHDTRPRAPTCRDTHAASAGDPRFPYLGRPVADLTLAELRTLDCDSGEPHTRGVPDAWSRQIPTLAQVLALPGRSGPHGAHRAPGVRFDVEIKHDPTHAHDTLPPRVLVDRVAHVLRTAGWDRRVTVAAFDWAVLADVRHVLPHVGLVGLLATPTALLGHAGPSPWLDGADLDRTTPAAAAAARHLDGLAVSAALTTPARVAQARDRGLAWAVWTLDTPTQMRAALGKGATALITDHPALANRVVTAHGRHHP